VVENAKGGIRFVEITHSRRPGARYAAWRLRGENYSTKTSTAFSWNDSYQTGCANL
jgi:hypothetical protein